MGSGESVIFFSSADSGLLAGIGTFTDTDGKHHGLIFSWTPNSCQNSADLAANQGRGRARLREEPNSKSIHATSHRRRCQVRSLLHRSWNILFQYLSKPSKSPTKTASATFEKKYLKLSTLS